MGTIATAAEWDDRVNGRKHPLRHKVALKQDGGSGGDRKGLRKGEPLKTSEQKQNKYQRSVRGPSFSGGLLPITTKLKVPRRRGRGRDQNVTPGNSVMGDMWGTIAQGNSTAGFA